VLLINAQATDCEPIIQAFEKEIEIKDLVLDKYATTTSILTRQRDEAFALAEKNVKTNSILLVITGAAVGCVAAGSQVEVRLGCLGVGIVTCLVGGCL
jgi:purine-nucleoside phosphorylase